MDDLNQRFDGTFRGSTKKKLTDKPFLSRKVFYSEITWKKRTIERLLTTSASHSAIRYGTLIRYFIRVIRDAKRRLLLLYFVVEVFDCFVMMMA